ncbi:MAG: UDP-N-acetylmuramate--L-alanine ligase [Actinomycetota bacterium]|nr:UDP-N-acetylmuramate--L-alanine ligase [Actinomycetota bacterium]
MARSGPGPTTSRDGAAAAYAPPSGSIPTLAIPDLSGVREVHLVGIGGAGMSGLARLLLARGARVTGSDLKDGPALERLRASGAAVTVGHRPEALGRPHAVVVSTAIPPGNPEVAEAGRRGIPVWMRAQVLAALMAERRGIAVAGTHGKTTTTSMLAAILEGAGLDPTYVIGGDLNESGSNARSGHGELFLAEADESDGSFLLLAPDVGVITNVEADHLDFYRDAGHIQAAFVEFASRCGHVVVCADDAGAVGAAAAAGAPVTTYGEAEAADVRVTDVFLDAGSGGAVARWAGGSVDLRIGLPGRHYLHNAAGALATAIVLGIDPSMAAAALGRFSGVQRRFEERGVAGGARFVDDYAHHPTEIRATLAAARLGAGGRVVAVFQPHRYSRTAALGRELGESLAGADVAVVTDVYAAGELPIPGISGKLLVEALVEARPGMRAVYLPRRADVTPFLLGEVRASDLVLTLGAGDVTMVPDEVLAGMEGRG